jgi:1,4-dihydroxy-2-naphthoate octaprenyltransferase
LNKGLVALYFALVALLVLTGTLGAWVLLTFLSLPRAVRFWKVMSQPKPAEKPANYPIWPLWFVAWAFLATRLAGGLFVLGLALNAIWPVYL